MSKGEANSVDIPDEVEASGKPLPLQDVVVCLPGDSYPFKPVGWTATFHLRLLSWTTLQRLMSEVAVSLGWSMERIPNPNPVEVVKRPLVAADSEKNVLYSQLLALRVAQEAVVGWDDKVLDSKGKLVPFNSAMLEYVAIPIILEQISAEVMTRSSEFIFSEKKS